MPPKQKFTRDQIINASLNIIRREGMKSITARSLASELGSSPRPLFTAFKSMEEIYEETIKAAKSVYNSLVKEYLLKEISFKNVGKSYIKFAKEEPKLFCLLFMTENNSPVNLSTVLSVIDDNSMTILNIVKEQYGLNDEEGLKLYQYLWIFTHGIASLCATSVLVFSEDEINNMLDEVGGSLVRKFKENKK